MFMSYALLHRVSLVSEVGIVMMVEGYFGCGVGRIFTMIKSASYIWLCNPWTRWWQCLCLLLIVLLGLLFGSPFLDVVDLLSF